jgi:hypothetical protein
MFWIRALENKCWKEFAKGLSTTTNFLEFLVDDEKVTHSKLNRICGGDQHIYSRVRIPKRRFPITVNSIEEQEKNIAEKKQRGANMGAEAVMNFKILFHFIKGKIFLTPMETILIILGKLEYLEGLVKLVRKRKDVEGQKNQIVVIYSTLAIMRFSINKTHHNKTLHLTMEIIQALVEGLVDTTAFMLIMATSVVKGLGIMHLVAGHETYKIAFGIMT